MHQHAWCKRQLNTVALGRADVDWEVGKITVTSRKTKRHGKAYRLIPLFPELRPILEQAFDEAEDGTLYVITKYRQENANLRTQFERILKRAGVEPWERIFQNLRASRETELADVHPLHVVTAWLGNTERVASKHYLQVTDAHFEKAQRAENSATTCQKVLITAPQESAASRTSSQQTKEPPEVTSQVTIIPTVSDLTQVPPRGVEPLSSD